MNKDEVNSENKYKRGSTCEPYLSNRMAKHRNCYKCYLNGTCRYVTAYEILKHEDADIILLEEYPVHSKQELHARERTKKEWNESHRESNQEYHKKYQTEKKDAIQIQRKAYRDGKKEMIKEQQKAWREANKEKIKLKKKAEYEANKEQICARMKANYEKKKAERN